MSTIRKDSLKNNALTALQNSNYCLHYGYTSLDAIHGVVTPMYECKRRDDIMAMIQRWYEFMQPLQSAYKDMRLDDLGSIYRDVARAFDSLADNLRDEQATTEVYR